MPLASEPQSAPQTISTISSSSPSSSSSPLAIGPESDGDPKKITPASISTTTANSTANQAISTPPSSTIGPIVNKKHKPRSSTPYSSILLTSDRQSRSKKRLSWQPDEKIQKVHYFELIADERVNVSRPPAITDQQQNDTNASADTASGSSPNAGNKQFGGKISNASVDPLRRPNGKGESDQSVEYSAWRPLVPIDFTPKLPSPGWNSRERTAQAERELYVLGAIDLPGQPSTLDEPEPTSKVSSNENAASAIIEASTKDEVIIPLDNPDGMTTEYDDMYNNERINGMSQTNDNPQPVNASLGPFCNQQSQLIPNQFQQQLIAVTNPNPFAFQDMGAQFQLQQQQQQAQMQLQFPFQQQFQQQSLQHSVAPFVDVQQQQLQLQQQQQQQQQSVPFVDQQAGLTGNTLMPWMNYPFNQVNENSHAHLFRRPTT